MQHANDFQQNESVAPWFIRQGANKSNFLIAGLVAASLLTIACSKEKSNPTGSPVRTSSTPAVSNQTIVPPVSPAPVVSQPVARKPAPKKTAKKHSSVVTYKDDTYGVSFAYPRKYTLKTGEDLKSNSGLLTMNFVEPGGLAAVSVELPDDAYPGTDLASAFFQVNVHKSLGQAECAQFAIPESKPDNKNVAQPSEVEIGDVDFREVENISGESIKQVDTKYYHTFENGACYEFALGLTTAWDGNEDGVNLVDREEVFRRLEKILAGVKITKAGAPAVASSDAEGAPPRQPEIVK
jgi:hypothetical protein